jgi:hypothetical protein
MEISNEVKAKVFAQYLGQTVCAEGFPNCQLEGIKLSTNLSLFKLLLRPLSAITDEDAIEVAKLAIGSNWDSEGDEIKGKVYRESEHPTIKVQIETFWKNEDTGNIEYNLQYIHIHPFNGLQVEKVPGQSNKKLSPYNMALMVQCLQSRGYDLPHYLLGGKTLKEAGLCIYEVETPA